MTLRIVFSIRAKQDLQEIVGWIKKRSPSGAKSWLSALEKNLSQISESAAFSTAAPEADDLQLDLRQRTFKTRLGRTYRLLFIVRDGAIYIITIRGAGQEFIQRDDIEFLE